MQRREYIAVLKGHTKAWDKENKLLKYASNNSFFLELKTIDFHIIRQTFPSSWRTGKITTGRMVGKGSIWVPNLPIHKLDPLF